MILANSDTKLKMTHDSAIVKTMFQTLSFENNAKLLTTKFDFASVKNFQI
jgi:hypothetical protein